MSENMSATLELKERQLTYLDEMVKKHNLPDRSKAMRCLINYAIQETDQEESIFTEIRCLD